MLLVSDDGQSLLQRAMFSRGRVQLTSRAIQSPLAWQAIRAAQPMSGQPDTSGERSVIPLCAPLVVGGTVFGALALTIPAETVSDELLALIDGLADYAAIGLERARLAGS